MIFLKDNAYMERDLTFDDIKPRLLGEFLDQKVHNPLNNTKRSLGDMSGSHIGIRTS